MQRFLKVGVVGLLIALASIDANAASVVSVAPQGEVAQVRQVTVKFSDGVIPFGDPRLPDPFAVACRGDVPAGSGRWANDRTWLYDFRDALGPGVRCTVTLRNDWKPTSASTSNAASAARFKSSATDSATSPTLTGRTEFAFNTGGPAVLAVDPSHQGQIEEDEHFLLRLSGPAVEASVAANAWCEVEGIGERMGVRVVGGDVRAQLLKLRRIDPKDAARVLILTCPRPLPNGAAVRLVWGRGIAAAANPAVLTTIEQRFRYTVRPAFTADFTCERERANAPCLPIRPMTLRFSAPIARDVAQLIRLKPAGGNPIAPSFDRDDKSVEVSDVQFAQPFPDNTAFTIELPPALRDNAGRAISNATSFPLKVATGDAPPVAKFAAAPFGIVERGPDAMLPVTLRHVQGDLRPAVPGVAAASAPRGVVRIKRLEGDADIFAWYRLVEQYHETSMTARELGMPKRTWTTMEDTTRADGKVVTVPVERRVGTREVSLLTREADAKRLNLPQLAGGDPRPFEVVGIPIAEPGYHVVEIESLRLGESLLDKHAPMFVRTGVLVTNLGVHFKHGRENSIVWVTSLDHGQPVDGADVAVNDCNGKPLWRGRTGSDGVARAPQLPALAGNGNGDGDGIDQTNPHGRGITCPMNSHGYFVTARKTDARAGSDGRAGTDVAFVFSDWQKGIESWRFNLPTGNSAEPDAQVHTIFDRTLFRAGETVSMKHLLRVETMSGLAAMTPAQLPNRVRIVHQGSEQEYTLPLTWSGTRYALSTWNIPPAAKLGDYAVYIERVATAASTATPSRPTSASARSPTVDRSWPSGNFRVEEFRIPLVDARINGPKTVSIAPTQLPIGVQLNYFSGGAMAAAPVRGTALLTERYASFAAYPGFSFEPPSAPPKRDESNAESPSNSDEDNNADSAYADRSTRAGKLVADKVPLTTDRNGAAQFVLDKLPKITRPSTVQAEATFNDPNGETQTVSTRINLWPSAVVLGIKPGAWASSGGKVSFTVLALDTQGQVVKGQDVDVRGRLKETITTRKRIVGGFYAYDNRSAQSELGALCTGTSDARGFVLCEATLERAGQVELIARTKDAQGHLAEASTSVWVTRQGELWFAQDNDDRIDVLPEKKSYEPGEIAHLQVRMPFRQATVLISIEREGVIATRVQELRGTDPTIAVKIEKTWGPNVYVSVLALRGRVRETPWYSLFTWGWREPVNWARSFWYDGHEYQAPTAMIDLAKPSFKFGVAAIDVGIAVHKLDVTVTTDKPQYMIRQKALARIKVTQNGKPLAGAEVAFAAVDEGLLALRDNASWKLLEAMIRNRAWGVETSTAQSEIIGRRHYGRKAVPAGGGGGRGSARELFDTLLLWKPNVQLDANGEALVEVPLNDSLTSYRLVAVADAGVQQFGTGSASINVSQDLQVLSGMPPLVREGDNFTAMLTLRNTTAHEMKVRATLQGTVNSGGGDGFGASASADAARSTGSAKGAQGGSIPSTTSPALGVNAPVVVRSPLAFTPREVTIAAGMAAEVTWPVPVPADAFSIAWDAAVEETRAAESSASGTAPTALARDRLRVTQLVAHAVPLRVLQATLQQLDGPFTLAVAAPVDALPSTGVKRGGIHVEVQPRLTGALPGIRRFFETYPFTCLEQKTSKSVGLRDPQMWSGVANSLPTYLDSDGLASYFPPRAEEGAHGSDSLTAYVLAATNEAGFELPVASRDAMLAGLTAYVEGRIVRKTWAPIADGDVRKLAAIEALSRYGRAQARMLGSINITPNVWPTAAVIDWYNILKRVDGVPEQTARRAEVQQILRSRLTYAGTTLRFSTEESDFWWWLMDSGDSNAARLILAVLDDPTWKDDLPRMVVGGLGRQRGGAWLTTTANLWGSLALDKFSARFESTPVAGRTLASMTAAGAASTAKPAETPMADWSRDAAGGGAWLPWPDASRTLTVSHQGSGKPWLTVQSLAAIELKAPLRAGYGITKSVTAVEQKDKSKWSRGDVVRVRIEIDAQSDMTWVVVSDPVPGGATILGSGLGRDSALATRDEKRTGDAWPAFEERGFEAFRSYYDYLPRGKHVVEYSVRLNNPGRFGLPPTRVEAMYAPETFGELPNAAIEVAP